MLVYQAQRSRSVDTPVLSSRRFYNSILTGGRSIVPEIFRYEMGCLLSLMGVLHV
jgi:hypothetical protein